MSMFPPEKNQENIGPGDLISFFLALGSPWGWVTFGGSRIFVTKMVVVSKLASLSLFDLNKKVFVFVGKNQMIVNSQCTLE